MGKGGVRRGAARSSAAPPAPSRAALPPSPLASSRCLALLPPGRAGFGPSRRPSGCFFFFFFVFGSANFIFFPESFEILNKTRVKAPAVRNKPATPTRPAEQRFTGAGCPPPRGVGQQNRQPGPKADAGSTLPPPRPPSELGAECPGLSGRPGLRGPGGESAGGCGGGGRQVAMLRG